MIQRKTRRMQCAGAAFLLLFGWPLAARAGGSLAPPAALMDSGSRSLSAVDDDDQGKSREEELYEDGTDAIDESKWQEAVEKFDGVIQLHGKRADAALYWKAWALNKLGRRPEALATLADL